MATIESVAEDYTQAGNRVDIELLNAMEGVETDTNVSTATYGSTVSTSLYRSSRTRS